MTRRKTPFTLPDQRVDERDTMFARAARVSGTIPYEEYYESHPDLKNIDDKLRNHPPLLSPNTRYYDKKYSVGADKFFNDIENIDLNQSQVDDLKKSLESDEESKKQRLKEAILKLGAVAVGFTDVPDEFVYSHHGRRDDHFGEEINNQHHTTIVFLVEMNHSRMQRAPYAEVINESAKQYYRAARIAKTLEAALVESRYEATSNFDANYELILPPMAVKAGLGEVGRNNILIADKYGSRVRIGAVTTNLEINSDEPISLGVEEFCKICKKCSENCPSHSLSNDDKISIRNVRKWPTHVESCYGYWRTIGTDCGICMAICPFSHKNNWFHNSIRFLLRYFPFFHKIALFFDDLIYGRRWKTTP